MLIDILNSKKQESKEYERELIGKYNALLVHINGAYEKQIQDCLDVLQFCKDNSISTESIFVRDFVFPITYEIRFSDTFGYISVHKDTPPAINLSIKQGIIYDFDKKENNIRNLELKIEILKSFIKYFPKFYKKVTKFVKKVKLK